MSVPTGAGNYPAGVTDNNPHFTDESDPEEDEQWQRTCFEKFCIGCSGCQEPS